MYFKLISQMNKQLGQLDKWLEAAGEYAKTKSFDGDTFLDFRLSPDQFAFARQVQTACDTAKLSASRLTGKEAPSIQDTEKTLADLRARVATTRAYLDTFTAKDFDGAATRTVSQPRWEGKTMSGEDYFVEHAIPNFYFHLSHSYALLRHNGVPVGKRDYLGALSLKLVLLRGREGERDRGFLNPRVRVRAEKGVELHHKTPQSSLPEAP